MPSSGMLCNVALRRTDFFLCSMCRLLVAARIPSSPIVTLMMEALHSSETSVLTSDTWHNILEDAILLKVTCSVKCCWLAHSVIV
jgi:hypothetical protein